MCLAAAYGIIGKHDGYVSVDSVPGGGTTFEVYLPAVRVEREIQPADGRPAEGKSEPGGATKVSRGASAARVATVLIVDDDESVLQVTQWVVERFGYAVLTARNGREAIEIARTYEGEIDLALLDMSMPLMSGAEAYPLLMSARPDLKVILCSGYVLDVTAQALLDAGASAFISKPFQLSVLRAEIRKALGE
jgi:CheY-like chemotaxis protein